AFLPNTVLAHGTREELQRLQDQRLLKLGICAAQEQPVIVRSLQHLKEGFPQERLALAAASRAAVEHNIGRAGVKRPLPSRRTVVLRELQFGFDDLTSCSPRHRPSTSVAGEYLPACS